MKMENKNKLMTQDSIVAKVHAILENAMPGVFSKYRDHIADYFAVNNLIPEISAELVFQAVDIIQDMASGYMNITDCLLYKKDEEFKMKVDIERERKKKEREKAKASQPTL